MLKLYSINGSGWPFVTMNDNDDDADDHHHHHHCSPFPPKEESPNCLSSLDSRYSQGLAAQAIFPEEHGESKRKKRRETKYKLTNE